MPRGRGQAGRRVNRGPSQLRNRRRNAEVIPVPVPMDPPVPAEGIIAADRELANVNQVPKQDMGSPTATTTGNNILPLNTNEVAVNINKTVQQSEPLLIPGFENETDVFLLQGLKEKVWKFEFVDLSQFLRQNFENNFEQRPSNLEVINGKVVLQQRVKQIKNIDNINTWTNAFLNYTSVLLVNHPSKASELIQYISIIRNVAEEHPTCRWLVYDQQFRLRISRNPNRAWNSIDGEL